MAIQDKRGKRFIEDYRLYDLEERELYRKLPHLHKWWNKLYLAETMGYQCGPGATEIPETKEYVIRPIYNLGGMGICTTIKILENDNFCDVKILFIFEIKFEPIKIEYFFVLVLILRL